MTIYLVLPSSYRTHMLLLIYLVYCNIIIWCHIMYLWYTWNHSTVVHVWNVIELLLCGFLVNDEWASYNHIMQSVLPNLKWSCLLRFIDSANLVSSAPFQAGFCLFCYITCITVWLFRIYLYWNYTCSSLIEKLCLRLFQSFLMLVFSRESSVQPPRQWLLW